MQLVYTAPSVGIMDAEKRFKPGRPYEEPGQAVKEKPRETMEDVAVLEHSL